MAKADVDVKELVREFRAQEDEERRRQAKPAPKRTPKRAKSSKGDPLVLKIDRFFDRFRPY